MLAGLAVLLGIEDLQNAIRSHLDLNTRQIRIFGIPDSGFFPNYDSPYLSKGLKQMMLRVGGPRYQHIDGVWFSDEYSRVEHRNIYGTKMKEVFDLMGVGRALTEEKDVEGGDQFISPVTRCVKSLSNPRECIFPEHLLKHITTPLFFLQVRSLISLSICFFLIFLLSLELSPCTTPG
jgi:hypothetical protein